MAFGLSGEEDRSRFVSLIRVIDVIIEILIFILVITNHNCQIVLLLIFLKIQDGGG